MFRPTRRKLLQSTLMLTASLGLLGSVSTVIAQDAPPVAVVELFTSQGCSSCPPADKLLGELTEVPHVIALTQAVDYWDYLGWKDENARHAHTERQQNYARVRGDRRIYTPQMVINGRVHAVGSRRGEVAAALKQLSTGPGSLTIPIETSRNDQSLTITIAAKPENGGDFKDGTLYLVPFKKSVSVDIKRGENRGRTVVYHNVVDALNPIGMWHGEALKVELPLNEIRKGGFDGCAVLLQADVGGLPGPIYGAAVINVGKESS